VSGDRSKALWLPNFRRSLTFLRPHQWPLIIGLLASIGVSLSYACSISAIVPVLKIILASHETVADWLARREAERRIGVVLGADLPDDPAGLRIVDVRPVVAVANRLGPGDVISALDGRRHSSYAAMALLAGWRATTVSGEVVRADGRREQIELALRPYRFWHDELRRLVGRLPRGADPRSRILTLAVAMAGLVLISLVGGVCRFANDGLVAVAVQRAMHDLRSRIGRHVLELPMSWHTGQPPGDTLARLATDISKVEVGQVTLFGKLVREPLKAAGVLALTLLIDWRLLVVALLGVPAGVLVVRAFGAIVRRAQRRASESWGRLLDHLGERLNGIRIVKAFNMTGTEGQRFAREDRTLTRAQTRIELVDAATNPALETLAMLAIAAFVFYGGVRVFRGQLEPHLFFAAVVCLGGVFDPIRKLGNVNNRLHAAEASAQRLFELLDLAAEPADREAAPTDTRPITFGHAIEFRDVWFSYAPAAPPVLAGINLVVEKGTVVAVVGPNGSGKTTLISLLLRFFEPTRGQILIDGRDIRTIPLAQLRAMIGLVTQDAVVFSDTLRANIAYGADGVPDRCVVEAARLARADEVAQELQANRGCGAASGYDVVVSAATLSGGQRQRVALARAILRDPPILILDEATSQVDSESERKIQEALAELTRNRTTFIIAHRFSTIARADRIVVLNQGRIVGCGTHQELLRNCPFYAELCRTQFACPEAEVPTAKT